MAVQITVVDDSKMSRKLVIRALPPDWDVNITQAANGVEALDAYHDGKAEIMFLDLTMPVMDGYETLEHLQKEELNTFVIVISADIQPEAQARVKKLGAMAFIKKPVKRNEIENVLHEYGII
jgi:CheY-like chemotaxis protein